MIVVTVAAEMVVRIEPSILKTIGPRRQRVHLIKKQMGGGFKPTPW